jgi:hypothetical protein
VRQAGLSGLPCADQNDHRRVQCLLHRHASTTHRHDPAAAAGQPALCAPGPGTRLIPARSRLQHRHDAVGRS